MAGCSRTNAVEGVDDHERSFFGNHMFVQRNGMVFDACAGPNLGNLSIQQYLASSIDISTVSEHYPPKLRYSECGVVSNTNDLGRINLIQ